MEKWRKRWEENQLRWHKSEVDPFLIKYLESLQNTEDSLPSSKQFFIPLCGKSLDVAYILSLGYKVFAVEGVRKAIEDLNRENELGLEFHEETSTYRSPDGKLQIYFGDLFACPIESWGPFDYVWDKGSLTAIDVTCRESYKSVMQKSVRRVDASYNIFKYLLRTVIYDKSKWDGKGPKCVSEEDMKHLYGDWTSISLVESKPLPDTHICLKSVNTECALCHENFYVLSNQ